MTKLVEERDRDRASLAVVRRAARLRLAGSAPMPIRSFSTIRLDRFLEVRALASEILAKHAPS